MGAPIVVCAAPWYVWAELPICRRSSCADCVGASADGLTTNFTATSPSGWETRYLLLPTQWTSDDKVRCAAWSETCGVCPLPRHRVCRDVVARLQAYLRRLVYEKYFRKEDPLPDEKELVLAIDGFGSFRPMQVCASLPSEYPGTVLGRRVCFCRRLVLSYGVCRSSGTVCGP